MALAGKIRNAVPTLLLRSPLHGLLSRNVVLLAFTGRKTGRRIQTPVVYSRDGDVVVISTDSPWWKNLQDGGDVELRLRGRTVQGRCEALTAPEDVAAALRLLCSEHPSYHRFAEIERRADGELDIDDAAKRRVALRITPNG